MRKVGYLLLILGFAVVMFRALDRITHALSITSDQMAALPQQDSFTREQVQAAMLRVALARRESDAFAVGPGILMLCGAVLLDRARRKGNGGQNVA
jgi:hypothetical protein